MKVGITCVASGCGCGLARRIFNSSKCNNTVDDECARHSARALGLGFASLDLINTAEIVVRFGAHQEGDNFHAAQYSGHFMAFKTWSTP